MARRFRRKTKKTGRKMVNKIVKAVLHRQVENKIYDVVTAPAATTYNGTVYSVTDGLAAGTGQSGRIGLRIKPMRWEIRWTVVGNPATTVAQTIRVIMFRSKNETGAIPLTAGIIQTPGAVDSYLCPYNYQNVLDGRFKIFYDKTLRVGASIIQTNTSASAYYASEPYTLNRKNVYFGKKLSRPITYTASATTVDDGGLYILVLGDQQTNGAFFDFYSRLVYEDS